MPLLDPDTGHPMMVSATESSEMDDESTRFHLPDNKNGNNDDDDDATQFSVEQSLTVTPTKKQQQERGSKGKGLFGRFRRRRFRLRAGSKKEEPLEVDQLADIRDQTPSPKPASEVRDSTPMTDVEEDNDEGEWVNQRNSPRKGRRTVAVLEEKQTLKQVRFPVPDAFKTIAIRQSKVLDKAPTAREAAFRGPPRYDWIDIETSAAIKVQSVARRNKCMRELEEQGITTATIRNRSRRRKAKMNSKGFMGSTDIPNLLACCGVGLAFGEATEVNYSTMRQHERDEYMERKKEKEAREEQLRKAFLKMSAQKKSMARRKNDMEETVEVVEETEAEEEDQVSVKN